MDAKTANQLQMLAHASSRIILFACECGDPACRQTVPLHIRAYRELRSDGKAVLHAGHTPVEDTPLAAEAQWVSIGEARVRAVAEALKIA